MSKLHLPRSGWEAGLYSGGKRLKTTTEEWEAILLNGELLDRPGTSKRNQKNQEVRHFRTNTFDHFRVRGGDLFYRTLQGKK